MKIVKRLILFFLILAILLAGCSAWIHAEAVKLADFIPGRSRPFASIAAERKDGIDVIVLGDSESYTSVSPMQLWKEQGLSSYVCGQPGQKIQETYFMLKTALQSQSPKVVLMETNLMFRDPGPVKNIQSSFAETARYHFPLLRFHNLWKLMFDGKKPGEAVYKGFSIRSSVDPFDSGDYMKETEEVQEMPQAVTFYMEEIMELCRRSGAELFLVSAPSPKNYSYRKHNAIENYAKEKGLTYVDLNLKIKELGITWQKDSYDKGDHLNLYGAQKVTRWLGTYLKQNYELTDHRNDPAYEDWNELSKKYEEAVKKASA
ncbi:SGNH/GDSL hydrolase family protein [Mediterraneibacter glycyrrhizinilyticus]|nr:SGNH/GDSL hydrolase family protein [Mediterraneibacter glycyrrhizinilyticus]MBM6853650.1 SGNH/GDSL hydrolase family protein [Mediterraneibacter glycyrrhizinilyticus]